MFVRRNKGVLCDFVTHINELAAIIQQNQETNETFQKITFYRK
jgi:hypothetical protein